jgi:hypothetical protein
MTAGWKALGNNRIHFYLATHRERVFFVLVL